MLIGSFEVPGFRANGPGFGGKINATVEAPTDDLSGNTDSTELADKGIKPKKLNVSFSLRFKEKQYLTDLIELVEARDGNEEAIKYDVVCGLSTALRIRQAQFAGQVNIEPDESLYCWHINFSLSEYRSVPEIAGERSNTQDTTDTEANASPAPASRTNNFNDLIKKMESS